MGIFNRSLWFEWR